MKLIVTPGKALQGSAVVPGDKSLSHRAALLAALADGESRIENFLVGGVTQAMLGALSALGVAWQLEGIRLSVEGHGFDGWRAPEKALDCGNSATTLRLLAGALAATGTPAILDGSAGLRRRPMGRIVEPLQAMKVAVTATENCAPLKLEASPRPLRALEYRLPVASAQVKSCLLLAGLAADGPCTLVEPGPSRDHSERMLAGLGVRVANNVVHEGGVTSYTTRLEPPHPLQLPPLRMRLPGDFSAAAFLIVAALVTPGAHLVLPGVGLNPTRTGLLDALQQMGGRISIQNLHDEGGEPAGDLLIEHSALHAGEVSGDQVVRMIDEFPAFAIAAAFARGRTVVRQADELRHKESDRIGALCSQLRVLGVSIEESEDGFEVEGGTPLVGGDVYSHGDHRLAMSLAIAGLAARTAVTIHDAECYTESFPEFVRIIQDLGGELRLEE